MNECDYCSRTDQTVRTRPDPYAEEVNGCVIPATICDGCYQSRMDDALDELNR